MKQETFALLLLLEKDNSLERTVDVPRPTYLKKKQDTIILKYYIKIYMFYTTIIQKGVHCHHMKMRTAAHKLCQ